MIVEFLKQGRISYHSRDLLKICVQMGASWSVQTLRHRLWVTGRCLDWCILGLLSPEELPQIFFTGPKYRWGVSEERWGMAGGAGCVMWSERVRCKSGFVNPAVKHIHFVGHLMVLYSLREWSPVVGDLLQASLCCMHGKF